MRSNAKTLAMGMAVAMGALLSAATALAQPVDTARIAAGDPNDWLTYHGSYKGWGFSGLDQINSSNVQDLQVAWTHIPGRSTRGLQSMPLVADGVLYYSGFLPWENQASPRTGG
jgi:glucose dehydrogenase